MNNIKSEEYEFNPLEYFNLSHYINSHESFKLKHIIDWCLNQTSNQLAEKLILLIHDENLIDMEKKYMINHTPFLDFAERGVESEYCKYLGYSMYSVK